MTKRDRPKLFNRNRIDLLLEDSDRDDNTYTPFNIEILKRFRGGDAFYSRPLYENNERLISKL